MEETAGPTGRNGGAVSGSRSGDVSPDRPQKPYRGDFEFVPPAADDSVSGMRSVLDSPIVNYRGPSAAKARSAAHVPARSMSMNRAMDSMRAQPRPTLESGPQQRGNSSQQRQVQQRRLEWLRQQQVIGSGVRR